MRCPTCEEGHFEEVTGDLFITFVGVGPLDLKGATFKRCPLCEDVRLGVKLVNQLHKIWLRMSRKEQGHVNWRVARKMDRDAEN